MSDVDITRDNRSSTQRPVSIRRTVSFGLSVRDLAESFCTLAADEQAAFLELVGEVMGNWQPHASAMQLHYMAREIIAHKAAREFLAQVVDNVTFLEAEKKETI